MRRKKRSFRLCDLWDCLGARFTGPVGVIMGPSRQVAEFVRAAPGEVTCYHMDDYEADQLEAEFTGDERRPMIIRAADLWDLPQPLQCLVYPVPANGERMLKIDMTEQAYHALVPGGMFVVVAPTPKDQLFPSLMKKTFGNVHFPQQGEGVVLWSRRGGDKKRRRHEVAYHIRRDEEFSWKIVSRPGVFSYGRFDLGARALVEVMQIEPGEAVLDMGCGCGTNGIIAGAVASEVVFVDSNRRALELARINAEANGLENFRIVPALPRRPLGNFDVALANPPYYAQQRIAAEFIERCRESLKPTGRLYLVTKQAEALSDLLSRSFQDVDGTLHRGYWVLCARRPKCKAAKQLE